MRKAVVVVVFAVGLITAASAGADSSRVGWWHYNEGQGTVANDASGYGNTGALSAGPQWATGVWGTALSFAGNGTVQVPENAQLDPSSGLSVTAWVKAAGSPGQWKYIVAKGASGCSASSYGLYTGSSGGLRFYVSSNAGLSYTLSPDAGASVWDGQWHFVAGTYDGSAVHLFVDGNEVGTATPVSAPIAYGLSDSNDLFVGHYPGSCPGQNLDFTGVIDEPQVWTRALSVSDQTADMHPFTGFFQPVDNYPTLNVAKAGSAIPVKFSLGADLGLGVLSQGSPGSHVISCNTSDPLDAIEQTVTSSNSNLQYDSTSNQYSYVWKTDKSWAGSCRQFDITLGDGSTHSALFKFTK